MPKGAKMFKDGGGTVCHQCPCGYQAVSPTLQSSKLKLRLHTKYCELSALASDTIYYNDNEKKTDERGKTSMENSMFEKCKVVQNNPLFKD